MNLTPPPPSQNSHAVRWHCTAESKWRVAEIKIIIIIIIITIHSLPLLLHHCFTHSPPYTSFLLRLNSARRSGKHCKLPTVPSEKMTAGFKKNLQGIKCTWSPWSPNLEGTRVTGPIGRLRLQLSVNTANNLTWQIYCVYWVKELTLNLRCYNGLTHAELVKRVMLLIHLSVTVYNN